jgi:hypothetical protein
VAHLIVASAAFRLLPLLIPVIGAEFMPLDWNTLGHCHLYDLLRGSAASPDPVDPAIAIPGVTVVLPSTTPGRWPTRRLLQRQFYVGLKPYLSGMVVSRRSQTHRAGDQRLESFPGITFNFTARGGRGRQGTVKGALDVRCRRRSEHPRDRGKQISRCSTIPRLDRSRSFRSLSSRRSPSTSIAPRSRAGASTSHDVNGLIRRPSAGARPRRSPGASGYTISWWTQPRYRRARADRQHSRSQPGGSRSR